MEEFKTEYIITVKRRQLEAQPPSQEYKNLHNGEKEDDGSEKWGYVTKPERKEVVTTEVFNQRVYQINMLDLVAAVNGAEWK